jgi:hypothetical protein
MLSFDFMLEQLELQNQAPLMDSGVESKAMQVVRSGLALRNKGDQSFWQDFTRLCANADGLADLLNVKPEIIASWASKIQQAIDAVQKHDQQHGDSGSETLMPTGEDEMTRPSGPLQDMG